MGAPGLAAVVAEHDHPAVGAFDALRPGSLVEDHPGAEEVVLQSRGDLRVLARQHLLAADDEGDPGAERAEHVGELHPGHTGPHHHEVLGQLRRRIGLSGGEDPLAVDLGPLGDSRTAAGRQEHGVAVELYQPVIGVHHDLVRALHAAAADDDAHTLAVQELPPRALQVTGDGRDALPQGREVQLRAQVGQAHSPGPTGHRHHPAGGDHRLRRDAVPQVGRAPHHVPFHERDLGSEARRVRGRIDPRRASTDDDEAHRHAARLSGRRWRARQGIQAQREGWYTPNSALSTSLTSPRVARRRSASFMGTRRFRLPRAAAATSPRAAETAAWSRSARTLVVRSAWRRPSSGSIGKVSTGSGSRTLTLANGDSVGFNLTLVGKATEVDLALTGKSSGAGYAHATFATNAGAAAGCASNSVSSLNFVVSATAANLSG